MKIIVESREFAKLSHFESQVLSNFAPKCKKTPQNKKSQNHLPIKKNQTQKKTKHKKSSNNTQLAQFPQNPQSFKIRTTLTSQCLFKGLSFLGGQGCKQSCIISVVLVFQVPVITGMRKSFLETETLCSLWTNGLCCFD